MVVAGTLKQELLKRQYVVFGSECVNNIGLLLPQLSLLECLLLTNELMHKVKVDNLRNNINNNSFPASRTALAQVFQLKWPHLLSEFQRYV